ncbi:DeoR/GlpR family DNA-binding transcription regulator [Calidifontibacillus erzurumensis]|uniref:DeoR/GlpR transcriptional regulator n=1 Tax=Calidifontibacillus erzurumensis TaxID=2741433 RepID=A0A8J8KBH1_9BACI|nr:DeoR/GlpR family DNA-binding transcription regulator [Calidifontibacillus erzurumensis]NSL51053.1 DeoR/GlpR transcriptional regulator [Calidifontibacillus erzurumensis]
MSVSYEERKKVIIDILNRQDRVRIPELINILGVSGETIRRDLDKMEKENLLKKVHGGAVREKRSFELPYDQKTLVNAEEKHAICKAAAELVEDGDIIMIGHGTTTAHMVHYLKDKKDVMIITPSIPILTMCLDGYFDGRVIFVGGELGREQKLTAGPIAERIIEELKVNKAFIAAGGISAKSGITDYDIYGANLSRKMMERADDVIVLADHSKFGKVTFAHIASLSEISILVTDKGLSNEWRKIMDSFEIKTIIG